MNSSASDLVQTKPPLSVTDIIGPIICGPSSSHTAGPCRIGNLIFQICGNQPPSKVIFTLYNSLAGTGFLHGTQIALLAGVQGIAPGDELLWQAPQAAVDNALEYSFIEIEDDPDMHPNSVLIDFFLRQGNAVLEGILIGESTGGGNFRSRVIKNPEWLKG
jgi:L-serine dehydratase